MALCNATQRPWGNLSPYRNVVLRTGQAFSVICVLVGSSLVLDRSCRETHHQWEYPVGGSLIAAGVIGYIFCNILGKSVLSTFKLKNHDRKSIQMDQATLLMTSSKVHQLCEINENGTPFPCSKDQIHELIKTLKNTNGLNIIPNYYLERDRDRSPIAIKIHTPLQYWAFKGDLATVQLLVKNGALDYFIPHETREMTSALYVATQNGQADIVDYLLKEGATGAIAFNGNVLRSFVPKFVFEICNLASSGIVTDKATDCLEKVLRNLAENDPENLEFQLRIPISDGYNSLAWVQYAQNENSNDPILRSLVKLLIKQGAKSDNAFTTSELEEKHNIGTGLTLEALSRLK